MKNKPIVLLAICTLFSGFLYSQISNGDLPISYYSDYLTDDDSKQDTNVNSKTGRYLVDDINLESVKNAENFLDNCKKRWYGTNINVNFDFFDEAIMYNYKPDTNVWILKIESQNAFGYHLIFDEFYLPEGCKLFVYNQSKTMTLGAFTNRNNRIDNRFVTQHIIGNTIYIELIVPTNINSEIKLKVEKIAYIFKDVFSSEKDQDDESCFRYTLCPEAIHWQEQIKSVALLELTDGTNWVTCTGTLINKENNYMQYDKPYLISAAHCVSEMGENGDDIRLEDCVAVYRYESDACTYDSNNGYNNTSSSVGFYEIEKDTDVDFLLLQLRNQVGEIMEYNVSFSGWDRRDTPDAITSDVFGIHHPLGKSKNIAINYDTPISCVLPICDGSHTTEENFLQLFYDYGNVHHGSSGSALFNSSKMIIGTLHGTDCNLNPAPGPCDNKPVFYGKLSVAWDKCNLYDYIASNYSTEYVPEFTLYAADVDMSHNLPVEIEISPENITIDEPSFIVRASTSVSVTTPVSWYLWINKYPNDMNNYNYGSNMCYSFMQTTGLAQDFESDSFYQFTTAGSYKATLFVYDGAGKQSTTDFSINIVEPNDPCISAFFWNNESAKQTVFRKGSEICLYDYCYVSDYITYSPGPCNEISLAGSDYFQPKYQGISRIRWYLNNVHVGYDYTYNTTVDYQYAPDAPNIRQYYEPLDYQFPFNLNTPGMNTIRLQAYAGKMEVSDDGIQYVHPFPYDDDYGPSSATKSFLVVDCEELWTVEESTQLFSNGGNQNALGKVVVNPNTSLTIGNGESVNWTSYNKIIINPGFSVENGGRFSATAKHCPEMLNCDNVSVRNEITENHSNVFEKEDISVFPNPAQDFFIIDNAKGYTYRIFNSLGKQLVSGEITNEKFKVETLEFCTGIYILHLFKSSKKGFNKLTKKIIIYE